MAVDEFTDPVDSWIDALDDSNASDAVPEQVEIVVDKKTGQPRQAGASQAEGEYVRAFKEKCERSLYIFCKGVLGLDRLTKNLHREVCHRAQRLPPYRKGFLLPRDHLKTSIFSRGMPIHMLIQPRESNIYRLGCDGASTRILLSNETSTNAEHFLRWIEARFESCTLLRAFWPHRCWDDVRREARKWNEKEMVIPRQDDYPEASIETIGVGGAVTSRHYDVLIKDDLISIEAANSPIVMYDAIEWHKRSRALLDHPDKSLEYIVGTRWAALDLYQYVQTEDPSVDWYVRSAIEDGEPIFPEMFSPAALGQIAKEQGTVMFSLLYMNNAVNPELVDFTPEDLRYFQIEKGDIAFEEDERDAILKQSNRPQAIAEKLGAEPADLRGMPLNAQTYDMISSRNEYLRWRTT